MPKFPDALELVVGCQVDLQGGDSDESCFALSKADAIILLLVLNGSAKIITQTETLSTQGLQVVRLEPNETHSIRALEDHTNILVIKQLTYASGLNKKLRFGKCCL